MLKAYRDNKRFRDYVDRYCRTYGCAVQEALTHKLVYLYYLEVKDSNEGKGSKRNHICQGGISVHSEIHQLV